MDAPANCTLCSLCESRRAVVNSTIGSSPIFLIGEAPGAVEEQERRPFVGPAGQYLRRALQRAGLKPDELSYANAVRCRPPVLRGVQTRPTPKQIASCRPFLADDIAQQKPALLILLGRCAVEAAHKPCTIAEIRGALFTCDKFQLPCIATYHPSAVMQGRASAEAFLSDLRKAAGFVNEVNGNWTVDVTNAAPSLGKYRVIVPNDKSSEEQAIDNLSMVADYLKSVDILAFDLETDTIDPYTGRILCISFSAVPGEAYVVPLRGRFIEVEGLLLQDALKCKGANYTPRTLWSEQGYARVCDLIRDILTSNVPKTGHNIAFDVAFCREQLGIVVRNVVYDTMLAHHLAWPIPPHNLEHLRGLFLNMPAYDAERHQWAPTQSHSFGLIPENVLWSYSAADADCERRLYDAMKTHLAEANPLGERLLAELVIPLQRTLNLVSKYGIPIDTLYLKRLGEMVRQRIKTLRDALDRAVADAGVNAIANYNSVPQLTRLLYSEPPMGLGLPREVGGEVGARRKATTEMAALLSFEASPTVNERQKRVLRALIDFKQAQKLSASFIGEGQGWSKFVREDGRIRPIFHVHGTRTGRLSSSNPNVQNLPRADAIRNIVAAPPDYKLIEADYSQVEARVLAYGSRCRQLLVDFQSCECGKYFEEPDDLEAHTAALGHNPVDVHVQMARRIFGIRDVTADIRTKTKTAVHGINYGRGPQSLARAFGISVDQARREIDRYFQHYPEIAQYHRDVLTHLDKYGYVMNAFGRIWPVPDWKYIRRNAQRSRDDYKKMQHIHREAIVMFPQGSTADILHFATVALGDWQGVEEFGDALLVHRLLKQQIGDYPARIFAKDYDGYICLSLHDSLLFVVPTKYAEDASKLIKETMEAVPRLLIPHFKTPLYGEWPRGWYLPVKIQVKHRWGGEADDLNDLFSDLDAEDYIK